MRRTGRGGWTARRRRSTTAAAPAGRRRCVTHGGAAAGRGGRCPGGRRPTGRERLAGLAPRAWAPDRRRLGGAGSPAQDGRVRDAVARATASATAARRSWRAALLGARAGDAGRRRRATALALTPPRLEDGEFRVERAARRQRRRRGRSGWWRSGRIRTASSGCWARRRASSPPARTRSTSRSTCRSSCATGSARVQLADGRSAAGVVLADDSVRRRKVGLMSGRPGGEAQDLVDPLHYLRKALEPFAEVIEAPLGRDAERGARRADPRRRRHARRGRAGGARCPGSRRAGCSIRFAGPRLAQSGAGQLEEDPLLPVRLRAGGRSIGGAMSWGAPRRLRPFPESSPFAGLPVPEDVDISSQVMAQPDPDLPDRVLASLEDGTPLVTGRSARRRAGGALPRHRQRRLVEPAALGALRADAGAADPERRRPRHGAGDAGRHGLDAAAGAGRLRRARRRRAWSPGCRASGWPRRGRRRRRRRGSTPAASGGWR